ncbi:MAG: L,D-transpeptidase [Deltaproteobacteria bacterium]|nr:L,D-transpeptidase [Deltaproteobacteria bacterium]
MRLRLRVTLHRSLFCCILSTTLCLLSGRASAEAADRPDRVPDVAAPAPEATPSPVPIATIRLIINIPARELRVIDQGQLTTTYPVAVGQPKYRSIVMSELIQRIEWNPVWYPPKSEWAKDAVETPPGPNNPLGVVKLPISRGILIHGTNNASSVGRSVSHGCFRMRNPDAAALAWLLQSRFSDKTDPNLPATYAKHRRRTFVVALFEAVPVDIVYEPIEVRGDTLYLYPDVYGRVAHWEEAVRAQLTAAGIDVSAVPSTAFRQLRVRLRKGKVVIPIAELLTVS